MLRKKNNKQIWYTTHNINQWTFLRKKIANKYGIPHNIKQWTILHKKIAKKGIPHTI